MPTRDNSARHLKRTEVYIYRVRQRDTGGGWQRHYMDDIISKMERLEYVFVTQKDLFSGEKQFVKDKTQVSRILHSHYIHL